MFAPLPPRTPHGVWGAIFLSLITTETMLKYSKIAILKLQNLRTEAKKKGLEHREKLGT